MTSLDCYRPESRYLINALKWAPGSAIDGQDAKEHNFAMKSLLYCLFPQLSRRVALKTAARACTYCPEPLDCYAEKPANICGYNMPDDSEPCWWIPICYGDRVGGGRIIAVSKRTGKTLYDGSDGGE